MLRSILLALTATLAALATATAATAATVTVDPSGAVVYRGTAGEVNHLSLQTDDPDEHENGRVFLYTSTPIDIQTDRCEHKYENDTNASCAIDAAAGFRAELGDGDDDMTTSVATLVGVPFAIDGGPGADRLNASAGPNRIGPAFTVTGGAGDDQLKGGPGVDRLDGGDGNDDVDGAAGPDTVLGGPGDDLLAGDAHERPSPDLIDGGPGTDRITGDWSSRFADVDPPIALTLAGGADDGRPGEGDDVRNVEDVVVSVGGSFAGSDAPEHIKGLQVGSPMTIAGGGGNDVVESGDGADTVDGGLGDDLVDGGFGDDRITGGPGKDQIFGDRRGGDCGPLWCKYPYGNDTIDAVDGEVDSIACGAGTDGVKADAADVVAPDCEQVDRVKAPDAPAPLPGPKPGVKAKVALAKKARLKAVLRSGLAVRTSGLAKGTTVRALRGIRTVASGRTTGKGTATLRFTASARRSLKKAGRVTLTLVAGSTRVAVTIKR